MVSTPRLSLAQQLAEEWRRREGRNLLAVAVYGSVASGTERAHSDIDLLVLVRRPTGRPGAAVRRGFLVTVREMTRVEAWDEVRGFHLALPEILGGWRSMRPLYDPTGLVARLAEMSQPVRASQFREAARRCFPSVYEDLGKLRDAIEVRDRARMREMAIWFTGGAAWLALLLDRHVVASGKEMFVEVRRIRGVGPAITSLRYHALSFAATSRLAEFVWSALRRKAARQRIPVDRLP